jgi:hypothetical protein
VAARVLIAVPCGDQVQSQFAYSLGNLMMHTQGTLVGPGQPVEWLRLMFHQGTLIAPQRRDLAEQALALDATHILWIDSDTKFPADGLNRLLARNKDYVGIVQSGRRAPCVPTAFVWECPEKPTAVYTFPESTGLQRVDAIGFGFTLCRTEVFKKVAEPWFPMQWGQTTTGVWAFNGEDTGFQMWVRAAGFELYVDHDLSKECAHIGSFPYRLEHALATKETTASEARVLVPDGPMLEYKGNKDLTPELLKPKLVK